MKENLWSLREFEVSPAEKYSCAVFQMIVDYEGVAILFSDEYSDKDSTYAKIMKKRLEQMIVVLNESKIITPHEIKE